MYAIVDCNSFYCACERVFEPQLKRKPVVVLSNNDGCIISRSDEAKELGVGMAGPYFKAKSLIEKNDVAVFSSNYNLYGDMSRRVMDILRLVAGKENVEVYSVDEAFVSFRHVPQDQWRKMAEEIRGTIEKWTGIEVSIGVAPTKTLAKLANHIAKDHKKITGCVAILDSAEKIMKALQRKPVKDLWGVGGRSAVKLNNIGVYTAWDLSKLPEDWARKYLGGVVGVRLIKELNGEEAIMLDKELINKKMIATTRMFGDPVNSISDIKEALATYTTRAAEKLRRQHSAAGVISVFVVPKEQTTAPHFRHGPTISTHTILKYPTSLTQELIKPAVAMAERIFQEGKWYKKAGVMLSGLVPDSSIQANIFEENKNIGRYLMEQMDNINFSMRDDVVKFASSGTKRDWKMRRQFHSPRYTSRWNELYQVK